jgi:hypothetical protein
MIPPTDPRSAPAPRAIFQDDKARGWLVEIQYGHPAPAELGIFAARFICPEDPDEPVRVGFVRLHWIEMGIEKELQAALAESDPASEIG